MKILKYFLYLYLIIGSLFAIKFNYDYARENTFTDWLLFGEIKPTLQGFIWPYYLFEENKINNNANSEFTTQVYFQNSINNIQKAFVIEDENINNQIDFITQKHKYSKAIKMRRNALENAKKVKLEELKDNLSDKVANSFKNDFIKGLELYFVGLKNEDANQLNSSSILLNNFGKIYSEWHTK